MKLRSILYLSALFFLPVISGCSGCTETEQTEAITAEITAAQMEGRKSARNFLIREWKDTTGLSKKLHETSSIRDEYIKNGKPECAAAYDSAFISTIRSVKPDLSRMIQKKRQ